MNEDIQIPATVGEMIEFLKKYPENWQFNVSSIEEDYYDTPKYKMNVETLDSYGAVNIVLK